MCEPVKTRPGQARPGEAEKGSKAKKIIKFKKDIYQLRNVQQWKIILNRSTVAGIARDKPCAAIF